jgi:GNAT superfamily N-acetyltransferase
VRLRPAGESDAPAVAACVRAAYRRYIRRIGRRPGPMRQDYLRVIRECRVTVAEEAAGKIVGVLVLSETRRGFLLDNVAVDPARQGRGVGRALLSRAEEEAQRAGHRSIHLYTHVAMTENRSLYERLGYVEFDRRTERGFTRVYMRKRLR